MATDDLDIGSLYKGLSGDIASAYGAMEKQLEEANKRRAGEEAEMKRLSAERQKLIKDVPEPATLPKFEDLPEPPKQKFSDPTQALSSPLAIFAMLGSLASRAPATAMLRAAGGVMQGFHAGEKEKMDYEMQRFDAAMRQAIAQQNQEIAKYSAGMDQKRYKAEVRAANIEAITAEYNDIAARETFRSAGEQGLQQLIQSRLQSQTSLLSSLIHWQLYLKTSQIRAGHLTQPQMQKNQQILDAQVKLKQVFEELKKDPVKNKRIEQLLQTFPGGVLPKGNAQVGGMDASDVAILNLYQLAHTPLYGEESGGAPAAEGEKTVGEQLTEGKEPVAERYKYLPDGFEAFGKIKQGNFWVTPTVAEAEKKISEQERIKKLFEPGAGGSGL